MIRVYCKNNGVTKEFEGGLTLKEIYDGMGLDMPHGVIAAKVNNVTEGLAKRIYRHKDVEFLDITSNDGMRMYVRSLLFIFMKAMNEMFPGETVRFENAISKDIPTLTVKEKERAEKPGEQGIFGSRTKERMLHVKRSG